ncbi:putative ubiquitin-like protein YukD [Bacillus ectoiniformans]|uniref:EsaB/YukD family protein n=1 Tax=Bacillus ectoiniformans TaxID=1494429 RepID=UPI00195AA809|nr:EsaB/YukD family protein [Bacillus ectoiniformans]MBM7649224.1 putative ubiquitin-like protein YukD [Bacillus ectoiniformans]
MYIQLTIDLRNYQKEKLDLRLSNYLPIKKVAEIAWEVKKIEESPRTGCWVRVVNKDKVFSGNRTLAECGITSGDRLEIL